MKRNLLLALLVAFGLVLAACGGDGGTDPEVDQDIVEVAQGTAELSVLVDALVAAGLDDDLKGDGPFTVFAPDNDAFAALLETAGVEDLTGLIAALGADVVTDVLQYHVVPGTFEAADFEDGDELTTLEDLTITVGVDAEGEVTLNDGAAAVTTADVEASNGVVHVIDTVLSIPEEEEAELDIVETAVATPELATLVAAVTAAELVDTLKGPGPFTVLAPTNEAFVDALAALELTEEELLASDLLADVLTYHVIPGEALAADLTDGQILTTVQGEDITVSVTADGVSFNDAQATVTTPDVQASNGVVHLIDGVLLYPSFGGVATEVELSGANEVPDAVESEFEGAATVTLTGTTLTVAGTYSEGMVVTDPGAHIHGPADATANAGILFDLTYENGTVTEEGTLTGQFDLAQDLTVGEGEEAVTYTSAQLLEFLSTGQLYINLHTEANPAGELRGQIVPAVEEDGDE